MTQQQVWVKCRAEIFYTQGDYVVEDDFEVRMNGQTLEVYTMGGPKNLVGFKGASQGQTPMARSNSPTLGHPKFPQAGRPDYDDSGVMAMRAAASLRR